ncbi:MAG: hypothetical protein ACH255_19900, partial [Candidatus Thiodiazotropha sp.]
GAQGANRLRFTDRFERFTTKAPGFAGGYLLIISISISALILFSAFVQYQNGDILVARMLITTWLSAFIPLTYIIVIFLKRITRLIESEAIFPDTYAELKSAIIRNKVSLNWHILFATFLCIFIAVVSNEIFI